MNFSCTYIKISKSFKQVNFAETNDATDSQGTGGKDLNENPNETTNFKEYGKRTKNPGENDYKQLKDSLDILREVHGINIALDKHGQRKLILEVPLNEPKRYPMGKKESKWNELSGAFDMTEGGTPSKRIKKYPVNKKNIPGTFEKISIRNYSGPADVSTEIRDNDSSVISLDNINEDSRTEEDNDAPRMVHSQHSNPRGGNFSGFSDDKDSMNGDASFTFSGSGKL